MSMHKGRKRRLPHLVWRVHDFVYYRLLPEVWRGAADYVYYRPDLRRPFGGAFNGQRFRRLVFNELLNLFDFEVIIETGSYTGNTTEYIDEHVNCPIYTVELHPRFYTHSRLRLRHRPNVHSVRADSRQFLTWATTAPEVPKGCALFYLDAHWNDDLPLAEELRIILKTWANPIIMIDDFQVPGDPGYTFDDYGPGKALTEGYLREHDLLEQFRVYYPSAGSERESGLKRGCVVE